MHTSHKHGKKSGNHNEALQDDFLEGTSARTRPLSFSHIMLKRKNRERTAKKVVDGARDSDIALAEDSVKKAFHSLKSDKQLNEDSLPMNSRHTVNDSQKVNSRRKEDDIASHKNEKLLQDKYKGSRDHEDKSKVMVDKNVSSTKVVTDKNEGHYHSNRDKDSVSGRDFGNESDIRRTKDLVKNERVSERPRVKSEITREQLDNGDGHLYRRRKTDEQMRSIQENESLKRNTRDAIIRSFPEKESQKRNSRDVIQTDKLCDSGKYKSENKNWRQHHNDEDKTRIRSTIEKHDSENRGLEFKQDYIEESMSKRRRPRSTDREHDKDRGRRSPLHSPKVHTQIFKDKREYGELSSHSVKDRAGREYSDDDKKKRRSRSAERALDKERVKRSLLHSPKVHKHISKDKRVDGELSLHSIKEKAGRDFSDAVMRRRSRSTERELNKEKGRKSPLHSPKVQKHMLKDKREHGELFSHSIKDTAGRDHFDAFTRRRSRSAERELNKGRGRKSPLHSPKVQKHMPKDKREHGELSSHSIKDRAGRDHSDAVKRRRSRSTERDVGKERGRSPLHSPEVHQHTSKDKKENGELSSQSINDRAGREHSDADKKIFSGNVSSTHYRRNIGSSSGLGGYSPRKRKSDTAAKTPFPTCRSPERKTAGWDLPPVGNESIGAGSTLSNLHASSQNVTSTIKEFPSGTPVTTTMMKPVGISHAALSSRIHVIESIQLTQATRPMRRLYVENLPALASEKDLMGCINKFLLPSGVNYIQGTQPCISCIINKEKGQALLEFLTPEDASAALSFDGIFFSGSNLKIRRPKDYADVTTALPDKPIVAVNSVSGIVEDSLFKIFIGGISNIISSKMLLEIVRAFGPVKAYHFEFIADSNEQCAFLEYIDHSVSSKACAALNGMRLGGQVLTTVFATPDAALVENMEKQPFYGIPDHAKPLLEKPTTVLKLKNVVDPEGPLAMSESEMDEVLQDIRLECSRFGTVKSINIAKPTNSIIDTNSIHEKNTNMSTDGDNLELDNKSFITEQLGESLIEMGNHDKSDPSENPNESGHNSQIAENNEGCDNSKSIEPRNSFSQENCDGLNGELAIQEIASVNESETNDTTSDSIPAGNVEMEKELLIVKLEENDSEILNALELDGDEVKELDISEEDDKKDPLTVFEAGSVLVEYKRAEAACIAAHCLHGRVFDGRVVTVEYVDHDLYQMTFNR